METSGRPVAEDVGTSTVCRPVKRMDEITWSGREDQMPPFVRRLNDDQFKSAVDARFNLGLRIYVAFGYLSVMVKKEQAGRSQSSWTPSVGPFTGWEGRADR